MLNYDTDLFTYMFFLTIDSKFSENHVIRGILIELFHMYMFEEEKLKFSNDLKKIIGLTRIYFHIMYLLRRLISIVV